MTRRTFVCRCEDVSVGDIENAIAKGLATIEEIKRYTGLGTGPCQGKECMTPLSRMLVARSKVHAEDLRPFTARPPEESVTFGALATVPDTLLVDAIQRTHAADPTLEDRPLNRSSGHGDSDSPS